MFDQRSKVGVRGKMMILGKDAVETARQQNALQREMLDKKRKEMRESKESAREEDLFNRHMESEKEQAQMEQQELPSTSEDTSTSYTWTGLPQLFQMLLAMAIK